MTGEVIRCECCGSRVRIVSSGEGTCSYVPALPELPPLLARGVAAIQSETGLSATFTLAGREEMTEAAVWLGLAPECTGKSDVLAACAALARVLPGESE